MTLENICVWKQIVHLKTSRELIKLNISNYNSPMEHTKINAYLNDWNT